MTMTKRRPTKAKTSAPPISLMLVDDHPIWRQTLRKILERRRFCRVVAEAGDGTEAVKLAGAASPDVVVMDIQLPHQNGIDATAELVAAHPDIRVLVLASSENRAQVIAAVEAGASGYLLKTAESDEVREAVRRVHQGELVFPPALAEIVLDALRQDRPNTKPGNSFRHEGDVWTISYEGKVFRLRDTRGVRYLARLVQHPGREFHSLDLVAVDRGTPGVAPDKGTGAVLDPQAKKAYANRILELEDPDRKSVV